jgi:cytoskeletal protein CcmA (bactofilin family)
MALFSKEPETNPKSAVKPTPSASAATPPAQQESASRSPGLALTPAAPSAGDARAYLDKGSKISGKLFFEGPVRIDGQVDGEISANDAVLIGEGAIVTAQLKAASVMIAGKISGDILASKRIEIRPTAKVFGNLLKELLPVNVTGGA